VPLDVAVEKPDSWIVCFEPQHDVPVRLYEHGIPPHRRLRVVSGGVAVVGPGFLGRTVGELEGVAVEVEWVFSGVVVVEDELDGLVLLEDEGVGVGAVDGDVVGSGAGGEGGVEGWDFGDDVGNVIEECADGASVF